MSARASSSGPDPEASLDPSRTTRLDDLDLAAMTRHAAAWDALVGEAAEPAPFFTRHVIGAHAAHGMGADMRFLAAWSGPRLAALLPYRPRAVRLGFVSRAACAWTSPFAPCSTPLVAARDLERNVALMLDAIGVRPDRLWLMPHLAVESRVGSALIAEARRRGWPLAVIGRFARPVLDRRADYEAYAAELPAGRRKDMARRWRRLRERGEVALASTTGGESLREAVGRFLELEAAGWKGARRTALASRPEMAAFAHDLFRAGPGPVGGPGPAGGPGPVGAMADTLTLDGRVIAASLALTCRGTAYLLKTAYDERHARFAPGLLLEDAIVRRVHSEPFAARLDSAATTATPLDELYPDREAIGDLVMAADPSVAQAALDRIASRETLRREGLRRAKGLYRRVRGGV